MPTTQHGIYYPDEDTFIAPLHPVFGAVATSVEEWINGTIQTVPVEDMVAANDLAETFEPTPEKPLIVWVTGLVDNNSLYYNTGSGFVSINTPTNVLLSSEQSLDGSEQAQVRANINAAPADITDTVQISGDLNSQTSTGNFYVVDTPNDGENYPVLLPGALEVFEADTSLYHRYTTREANPRIFLRSEDVTTSTWSEWKVPGFSTVPRMRAVLSAKVSLSKATWKRLVGWTTETYDTADLFDIATGRATIPETLDGLYRISVYAYFNTHSKATRRILSVRKNSTTAANSGVNLAQLETTATGYYGAAWSDTIPLVAGDTLDVIAYASSASSILGTSVPVMFSLEKID